MKFLMITVCKNVKNVTGETILSVVLQLYENI